MEPDRKSNLAETTQAPGILPENSAVYLTPYLKDGQNHVAQGASHVSIPYLNGEQDLDSWSGYISVGQNSSYHLFFWFFCCTGQKTPEKQDNELKNTSTPLLIWLNGGPGYSSMVGLFEEVGPLKALSNGSVTTRDSAWTNHFDVIFIDALMDTGFSYSDSGQRTKSVKEAAELLYEFMDQFYQIFSDARAKDLYICGESFGGKYAPELAHLVKMDKTMNLKGVLLASGLMNPRQMLPLLPNFLESVGMLNGKEARKMKDALVKGFEKHEYDPKGAVMDIVTSIFSKLTAVMGHSCSDNILYTEDYKWTSETYLNQPAVQKAIHARPTQFAHFNDVIQDMAEDFLNGVQEELKSLLDSGVKVLVYNGQLDPEVSVPMTEEFLSTLNWSGAEEYMRVDKVSWKDADGTVVGYVTEAANLTRVVLCRAGHRTAIDKPGVVLNMVKRFMSDLPFSDQ